MGGKPKGGRGVGRDGREVEKKLKREVEEENGLKLSITKGGKEGKSKVIISCCDFEGHKMNFANSKTLVDVATDRGARNACLHFFSFFLLFCVAFLFVFFCWHQKNQKHQ